MEDRQTTCHTVRGEKRSLTLVCRLRCWLSCWIRHQWMSPLVSAGVQGWSAVNASSSGAMAPPGSSDSDKRTLPASEGRIWSRPLDWDPRSPATHLCSLNLISLLCICVLISKMGNSCIPYPLAVLWGLMLLSCGVGEDSWESLGQQRDKSQS